MATEHYFTKAVWETHAEPTPFRALPGNIEVDVAVVGGGITGLTAAYNLTKAGKKVVVLEGKEVAKGTTGSSTGNLYIPIGERLFSIAEKHDEQTMHEVALSRKTAIDFIESCIKEHSIDCEFKRVPWYLFTTPETSKASDQVNKEFEAAQKLNLPVINTPPEGFPFKVDSITCISDQAQYNPLAYTQQLAGVVARYGGTIYESTRVTEVKDGSPCEVITNRGVVRAQKVIMATHSPKGIYAVHTAMAPYREFVLGVKLKGTLPKPGIYWHIHEDTLYSIRPYSGPQGNYLVVLGRSQKVGHKKDTEKSFKKVEQYLEKHFSVESIEYVWAAQNYEPVDNLPYIGTSPVQTHVYIATGFAADGLVYGTLSGMILSDLILEKKNQWAKIYDPKRFTPVASAKKFLKDNIDVARHLIKDHLIYGEIKELKELNPGEGKTISIDGEKVAAYRDDNKSLHLVSAICPHMGCVVHWNNGEKSWDCPCHGSRFSVEGEVLEGPAYKNLARAEASGNKKTDNK